jgi:hypothetical protein
MTVKQKKLLQQSDVASCSNDKLEFGLWPVKATYKGNHMTWPTAVLMTCIVVTGEVQRRPFGIGPFGIGHRASGIGHRASGIGHWASGIVRALGIGHWALGIGH